MATHQNGTALTVLALQGEDVKRVRALRIVPPARTGLVKIAGKNGAGKSSTLELIMLALGGAKVQPTMPIRKGAKKASGTVELQDAAGQPVYRVTRTWSEGGGSYLTVERIGEGKVARPQDFLDSLIGAGLGFDPAEFTRLKPAKQIETLLGLIQLAEDPRALDMQRAARYEERTAVNRELKSLDARLRAIPDALPGVLPAEEVSIAALSQEARRLAQVRQDNRSTRQRAEERQRAMESEIRNVHAARVEFDRAQTRLSAALAEQETATAAYDVARRDADHVVDPDPSGIEAQIATAEVTNVQIRQQQHRRAIADELEAKQREVTALTAAIEEIDARKADLLATAQFPVPGLGFGDVGGEHAVTFNGVPLADCAESEQMLIGMAIAMACNPTMRVILLREGSLLDAETLAAVERLAGERGYQVWTELVGAGDAGSFVIEDGGVISGPGVLSALAGEAKLPW